MTSLTLKNIEDAKIEIESNDVMSKKEIDAFIRLATKEISKRAKKLFYER